MGKRKTQGPVKEKEGRRKFLKGLGLATVSLAGIAVRKEADASPEAAPIATPTLPVPRVVAEGPESPLLRMQRDLHRALKKPVEDRRWVMVIDLRKCIGCHACTIACISENKLPPGVVYRPVIDEELGEYPHVGRRFIPRPCMQCAEPPCVPVCPTNATYKRPDGVVEINYDQCIGCRYCITACPYQARYFDFGENVSDGTPASPERYETSPSPEYGKKWPREEGESPIGNVRKCQFCLHRLNAGMLPACVTTCVGYSTFFGDVTDHESLVAELVASPRVVRLKEELGTEPQTYYLM